MKKSQFSDLVFTAVESGETQKVIKLYEQFPKYINKLTSSNNWTPVAYACRYGNIELVKYFIEKKFNYENNAGFNLLHVCCLSGELEMLSFLLKDLKMDQNMVASENQSQNSPMRIACKYQFYTLIECLYNHGAYVADGYVGHNVIPIKAEEFDREGRAREVIKYRNFEGNEVPGNAVLRISDFKDERMKLFFRWLRYRNFLCTVHVFKVNKTYQERRPFAKMLVKFEGVILKNL